MFVQLCQSSLERKRNSRHLALSHTGKCIEKILDAQLLYYENNIMVVVVLTNSNLSSCIVDMSLFNVGRSFLIPLKV